jgi:hypothetical protein
LRVRRPVRSGRRATVATTAVNSASTVSATATVNAASIDADGNDVGDDDVNNDEDDDDVIDGDASPRVLARLSIVAVAVTRWVPSRVALKSATAKKAAVPKKKGR